MTQIVSFSLYNDRRRDVLNAVINCALAPSIYPGWTCRFYLDDTVPKEVVAALESFDHVELRWMPRHTSAAAKLWRFLAAGDPDVDALIVRDADSWLSTREAVCVQEWLSSGRDFHLIRDHCYHSQPMMGGMWGVRGGVLADIGEWIAEYERAGGTYDQGFLADRVYPLTVGRALVHRGDQHDGDGRPTDYFHDGAVPIPDCDEVDEAVAGISWFEAHRLNAFTCSHCRQVHPTYIGPIFEVIPAAALEVVQRLGVAKVVILIVSVDNGDRLTTTLESVFANTRYPNFEVIVVDNGSAPELLADLDAYATRESRLRLIRNNANLGFAAACGVGIGAAGEARRIILLGDDAVVSPGWLSESLLLPGGERTVSLVPLPAPRGEKRG